MVRTQDFSCIRTSQFTAHQNSPHSLSYISGKFLHLWSWCRSLTLSALSFRPMEKVLSGALTPSTARTWSKPWRSSTSLPHMPSAHHPPPHPGKLSSATVVKMSLYRLWCCRKLFWKPQLAYQCCQSTIIHLFTGLGIVREAHLYRFLFYFGGVYFYLFDIQS